MKEYLITAPAATLDALSERLAPLPMYRFQTIDLLVVSADRARHEQSIEKVLGGYPDAHYEIAGEKRALGGEHDRA